MITLRCTRKAARVLGLTLDASAPAGTSPLGDWYVNLIPTTAGGAFLFVNEQSLLAVVVPIGEPDLLNAFVRRVANILAMIGVPFERIEQELEHFAEARAGTTASRRVLTLMNDLAFRCRQIIARAPTGSSVSLSDLELALARMPQATLGVRNASQVALELLGSPARFGAV